MLRPDRKSRTRLDILDAADAAFREIGFDSTSMEEISRRAGVTRMTIYNLFASKVEIARAIIARTEAESDARYRARMAAGESATLLLRDAFVESARWCLAHPTIAPIALTPPSPRSVEPPAGRPSFHGLVADILALGQRQGDIRADMNPLFMVVIPLGAFAQVMLHALSGGPYDENWIACWLRLIVEGIGTRPPSASLVSETRT